MTTQEIQVRIGEIKSIQTDDELAHSREDELYADFIDSLKTHPDKELAEKAALVLTTKEIDFCRWCA